MKFTNAQQVFEYYYDSISDNGIDFNGTKAFFNVGFTIVNPLDNNIKTSFRNFNIKYAEAEWLWYMSANPKVSVLGELNNNKIPKIWKDIANEEGEVNSNYGYQINRNNQLDKVVDLLIKEPETRRATLSIYDGKEMQKYNKDTPCTYAIQFTILNNKLNMSVYMRSNDLWFGFCNDQYCFSNLQKLVSDRIGVEVGEYYHHAHNLHVYNNFLNKK